MNKRTLYYLFNPTLRRIVRRLYYLPVDLIDYIAGKHDKLTPPKGKVFVGSGDFITQGERLLQQLIKFGNLKPHYRVLDVGCGIGRLAVPLTKYLNEQGSYEGFDIVKTGIKWCRQNISKSFENFNFKHIDLKNELYNLSTKEEARKFVFPYKNAKFDLVFLFSVFSHMVPEDADNYLAQIYRVLKNNGVCFATFFVLNNESKQLMETNDCLKFKYDMGNHVLHNRKVREANVAYKEDFLIKMIEEKHFQIENVFYGYWAGRKPERCVDFQDTVILRKKSIN